MKTTTIIIISFLAFCLAAGGLGISMYRYATTPSGTADITAIVWVKPGQSFSETMTQLREAGLVRHPERFRWLAYLKGDERRIRAGEYVLRGSMPPLAILETLVRGKGLLHKVVIPEGFTMFNIGQLLESTGLVLQEAFLKAACDPSFTKTLAVEADTFEGYLFPETYHFAKGGNRQGNHREDGCPVPFGLHPSMGRTGSSVGPDGPRGGNTRLHCRKGDSQIRRTTGHRGCLFKSP